mgnify:FL=1
MAEFQTYDFANYPKNGFIEKKEFADPTDEDNELITQYNELISSGNLVGAKELLDANPELIKKQITSEDMNRLSEELRNTEITVQQGRQSIYYGEAPTTFKVGDVWIH